MKKQKQTLYLKQRTFDVYTSFYESKTNDLDTMLVCCGNNTVSKFRGNAKTAKNSCCTSLFG